MDGKFYIIPKIDKPIKIVYEGTTIEKDENGDAVVTRKLSQGEIYNLFMELFGATNVGIVEIE